MAVALVISGCGSGIPGDSVADVAGNPITTRALDHWMYVAAKGQASQSPGQPVIVPNDPPNFTNCLAQVRKQIPALKNNAKFSDAVKNGTFDKWALTMSKSFDDSGVNSTPTVKMNDKDVQVAGVPSAQVMSSIEANLKK